MPRGAPISTAWDAVPGGPTRDWVLRKVAQLFPSADQDQAIHLLDQRSGDADPAGDARIQLAAIKLSNGSLTRLRNALDLARTDYRDLLCATEFPEESATPPQSVPEMLGRIRAWDRQQYLDWLHDDRPRLTPPAIGPHREIQRRELPDGRAAVLLGDITPIGAHIYTWILRVERQGRPTAFIFAQQNPYAPLGGDSHFLGVIDHDGRRLIGAARDGLADRESFLDAALALANNPLCLG